ncbi:uncharacterized membrane protein YcaP (DUF421 family) [Kroppenstedtia sanguinis]|uniref:YetF domain-containing protein n=1 Tax=Kroppenstedtia sanguinis TaxID=1380684 RepID=UPI003D25F457
MSSIWQAFAILTVGYILIWIAGKKVASEMTGLELITLLGMASMIGYAVPCRRPPSCYASSTACWSCVIPEERHCGHQKRGTPRKPEKIRMSVDQLEGRMRSKGIHSFADVKTGTIEVNGEFGYE